MQANTGDNAGNAEVITKQTALNEYCETPIG